MDGLSEAPQCGDGIEYADKIRIVIWMYGMGWVEGSTIHPEAYREPITGLQKEFLVGSCFMFVARVSELVDVLDSILGQLLCARVIERKLVAIQVSSGDAAKSHYRRDTSDGVGTATEPEEKNSVIWLREPDDCRIAIDDVSSDAQACG
jgi:hypothetical protein